MRECKEDSDSATSDALRNGLSRLALVATEKTASSSLFVVLTVRYVLHALHDAPLAGLDDAGRTPWPPMPPTPTRFRTSP